MNLAPRTVLCSHTRLGPPSLPKIYRHVLEIHLRCIKLERLNKLLCVYGKNLYKKVGFMDEKTFTIEQKFNKENDKVYAQKSYDANAKVPRIQRGDGMMRNVIECSYSNSFLRARNKNDC